jgi:hypothetical protein
MRAWISFFTSFWMPSGTGGTTRGGALALTGAIGGKGWVGRDCVVDKGSIGNDEGGAGWIGAASIGTRSTGAALASSGGCSGVTCGSLPSNLASAALALSSLLPATD